MDKKSSTGSSKITANDIQVGGDHYRKKGTIQHWDFAAARGYDYFQGQITKYVDRWKDKNGIEDLKKARHFLDKYIEIAEAEHGPEATCNCCRINCPFCNPKLDPSA